MRGRREVLAKLSFLTYLRYYERYRKLKLQCDYHFRDTTLLLYDRGQFIHAVSFYSKNNVEQLTDTLYYLGLPVRWKRYQTGVYYL